MSLPSAGLRRDIRTCRGASALRRRTWPTVVFVAALVALMVASPGSGRSGTLAAGRAMGADIFFDDFDYRDRSELVANGWTVRTRPGGPGALGARWVGGNVRLVADPAHPGNRLLRLTASTDGTVAGTRQAEVATAERRFLEGTYATRIRFSDVPDTGAGADRVVQTFFTIGPPLARPLDPAYSELDFEYLAHGGWGSSGAAPFMTSWDTYQEEPVIERSTQTMRPGSLGGWHTLVLQVHAGTVRYFVDGRLAAEHGGRYYPDSKMAFDFNLWFQRDGLASVGGRRGYSQDVDWVFQESGTVLTPEQVAGQVAALRQLAP
jgi:hypothetical protein